MPGVLLSVLLFRGAAPADQGATPAAKRAAAAWRFDLDQIGADIRSLHPDPFTKTGRLAFARRLAALRDRVPTLSEEQRVVEAMRLAASIGRR